MSIFLKQMINNKIKQLHKGELMQYAGQYGFQLTDREAEQILNYLQQNNLDLFSKNEIEKLHKELAVITNDKTANNAKTLFEQIIKTYGLEHLFE